MNLPKLTAVKSSRHRSSSQSARSISDEAPTVYISGPVTGVMVSEDIAWRDRLRLALEPTVRLIDPLTDGSIRTPLYRRPGSTSIRSLQHFGARVIARNRHAVESCDLLFANLTGCGAVSLGSVGEIFWADAFRKPILIVRDASGNPHDHLLLNEIATSIFFDFNSALNHLRDYFNLPAESSSAEHL
jgi:hypothetical protein